MQSFPTVILQSYCVYTYEFSTCRPVPAIMSVSSASTCLLEHFLTNRAEPRQSRSRRANTSSLNLNLNPPVIQPLPSDVLPGENHVELLGTVREGRNLLRRIRLSPEVGHLKAGIGGHGGASILPQHCGIYSSFVMITDGFSLEHAGK